MVPVFDGHNDALTNEDHDGIASGRPNGHLDLPRMRAGGVRGGMFAVFSPSAGSEHWIPVPRDDGIVEFEYAQPLGRDAAAAHASAAAGRLLALERAGDVSVARAIGDFDRRSEPARDAPPLAVLHLEGAEAIDPDLAASTPGTRPACARSGRCGAARTTSATACRSCIPSLARHRPGPDRSGRRLVDALRRARHPGRPQPSERAPGSGMSRRPQAGPLVATHAGAHALVPGHAQPDRPPARRDRRSRAGSSASSSVARSCAADMEDDDDTRSR